MSSAPTKQRLGPSYHGHQIAAQPAKTGKGKLWQVICSCGWTGVKSRKATTALACGTADHLDRICPTPGKRKFKDRAAAEQALLGVWQSVSPGKTMPSRVYECHCGNWHWTSKPRRNRQEQQ